eukprot:GHVT01078899.1.p1 GENE.GHVT01078899.1~~GHVT01078899.1.p1  ORF type:complete len:199 (-),score=38.13 GHVT01078899.1:235-831(-)
MGPAETDPALFPLGGCRDVVLEGAKTQLVPFREAMVETYAAWMQNEDLLHLTGTDGPMSPADVENMRKLYHEDPYRQLFIISRRQCPPAAHPDRIENSPTLLAAPALIGDVACHLVETQVQIFSTIIVAIITSVVIVVVIIFIIIIIIVIIVINTSVVIIFIIFIRIIIIAIIPSVVIIIFIIIITLVIIVGRSAPPS